MWLFIAGFFIILFSVNPVAAFLATFIIAAFYLLSRSKKRALEKIADNFKGRHGYFINRQNGSIRQAFWILTVISFLSAEYALAEERIEAVEPRFDWMSTSTVNSHYVWGSSPQEAFNMITAQQPNCSKSGEVCATYSNLHPAGNYPVPSWGLMINGKPAYWMSDATNCVKTAFSSGCYSAPNGGAVVALYGRGTCPRGPGWSLQETSTGANNQISLCIRKVSDVPACNDCGIGNPILPATGEKLQVETDYVSTDGLLEFTRTYRSTSGLTTSVAAATLIDNSQKNDVNDQCYWSSDYEGDVLAPYCWPYMASGDPSVDVHLANGRQLRFLGTNASMTALGSGNEQLIKSTDSSGKTTQWLLRFSDNSASVFDAKGRTIRTLTPNNRAIDYSYSDATTPSTIAPRAGLLISMKDDLGRQLSFAYSQRGQLNQMRDPSGKVFLYTYDNYNNLTSVTYPDGKVRTYWYGEEANIGNYGRAWCFGSDLTYGRLLTGITDERGVRFANFTYQCDGKAVTTEHAGGAQKERLVYKGNTTTVFNEFNKQTIYHFAEIAGALRVTSVEGQATAHCIGANQNYSYTPEGWLASQTDWNGNKTTFSYNTKGQETARTEAFGTPEARTTTTEWDPTLNLKTKVTEPQRETTFSYDANGYLINLTTRSLP